VWRAVGPDVILPLDGVVRGDVVTVEAPRHVRVEFQEDRKL
jgi:hypothetical protein